MSYKNQFLKRLKELIVNTESGHSEESLRFLPQQLSNRRKFLMKLIQLHIIEIVKSISNGEVPSISIGNSRSWKNCEFDGILSLTTDDESLTQNTHGQQTICSFGATSSKDKFTKIIFLLSKIYRLLLTSSYCTVRELYYQNITLFQSQTQLSSSLNAVCNLLDALPWELSLQSTSKGLIAGLLTVVLPSGELLDFNKTGGVLVPQDVIKLKQFKSEAKFVLVVEKDAAFQKLLDENALEKLGPCIIITGKGYPDINTRLMLRRIWEELKLPILALTDCDPYGIEIMCVYRFGSLGMSQQNKMLAVPALKWLGVHPQDIQEFNIPGIPLTSDDFRKVNALKSRPYITSSSNILTQINVMIESKVKCEIEGFSHISPTYLSDVYIHHKVCCNETI